MEGLWCGSIHPRDNITLLPIDIIVSTGYSVRVRKIVKGGSLLCADLTYPPEVSVLAKSSRKGAPTDDERFQC